MKIQYKRTGKKKDFEVAIRKFNVCLKIFSEIECMYNFKVQFMKTESKTHVFCHLILCGQVNFI